MSRAEGIKPGMQGRTNEEGARKGANISVGTERRRQIMREGEREGGRGEIGRLSERKGARAEEIEGGRGGGRDGRPDLWGSRAKTIGREGGGER